MRHGVFQPCVGCTLAGEPSLLEFVATTQLRALSLSIFDRSFAVTYYLQAVAIVLLCVGMWWKSTHGS